MSSWASSSLSTAASCQVSMWMIWWQEEGEKRKGGEVEMGGSACLL